MSVVVIEQFDSHNGGMLGVIGVAYNKETALDMMDEFYGNDMLSMRTMNHTLRHGCIARFEITVMFESEIGVDEIFFMEHEIDEL